MRVRSTTLLWIGLVLGPLRAASAFGQRGSVPNQQLYMISATMGGDPYPVVLYRARPDKKLERARQVVPAAEGIYKMYAWGDMFLFIPPPKGSFSVPPPEAGTTISIVHAGDPLRTDDVMYSPPGPPDVEPDFAATAVVMPKGTTASLLMPFVSGITAGSVDLSHIRVELLSLSGNVAGTNGRVTPGRWDEYADVRWEGSPGGPAEPPDLFGSVQGNNLVIDVFGHSAVIDELPPVLRNQPIQKNWLNIIGVSENYLIVSHRMSADLWDSGLVGKQYDLFVHQRVRNVWSTIQTEGNAPAFRLFDPWLAMIVRNWNPDHRPSPGRGGERQGLVSRGARGDMPDDGLPPVRMLYAGKAGYFSFSPGMLVLTNLADGRRIRIETGQEDSEILRVERNVVIYRVNDTIYRARISGTKLRNTTIIVKDDDVPEIHWVFWSK